MSLLVHYIFIAIISILVFFLLYFDFRIIKKANKRKEDFISYLEKKGDFINLKKFGFYNSMNHKEFRRVPFLDELIYEEYKLNSDEEFLAYYRDIRKSSMLIICLSFLAFLLFCIIVILVNMKYQ